MGKLTGLLMIAAGLGTAAYVYPYLTPPDTAAKQLADVVAITTPGATPAARPQVAAPVAPPRIISADATPGKPALSSAPVASVAPPAVVAVPLPSPSAAIVPAPVPAPPMSPTTVRPIEPPVPQPVRRTKADDDRVQLARDIQRELKRVGCLQSDADGTWNASTRAAMQTFIERVNATLPTDEPDHILKTLVQGHPGNACGKGTSPASVVAQATSTPPAKRDTKAAADVKPETTKSETKPSESRIVAKAEPKPAEVPAVTPAASSWQTTITPSLPTVTPPAMAAIAALAGAAGETKPSTALPGRMAIGAPLAEPEPPVTSFKADGQPKVVVKPKSLDEDDAKGDDAKREEAKREENRRESREKRRDERSSAEASRRISAPPVRVAAYRAAIPPPRYVGAYGGSSSSSSRPRFGPQIFKQLEQSGR